MLELSKKWLPNLNDTQYPKIITKQGGHSAYYCAYDGKKTHFIAIRINVWNNLTLAQKRLLIIHEFIHSLGQKHSSMKSYLSCNDMLSILVYEKVYGNDEHLTDMKNIVTNDIISMENNVSMLNKRKLRWNGKKLI